MEPYRLYLIYSDDGASLAYAGADRDAYARFSEQLAATHAGSLVGARPVGPAQLWEVRAFFHQRPTPEFIAQRRHFFRFRLDWESGQQSIADAAS